MNIINICKVCGAENPAIDDMNGRCFNCDNDLNGTVTDVSRTSKDGRYGDSIYKTFAVFYVFVFLLGLGCYLNGEPQMDGLCLALTFIGIFHLMLIQRMDKITGFYKGPNRYNMLRRIVLYAIIGLFFYNIAMHKVPANKEQILYLVMMIQSLMLFYTYCFGKKHTDFNYFNFFYDDSRPSSKVALSISLFNYFKQDTSSNWPEHRRTKATLDFYAGSLNGIKLGSPGTSIRTLGKPSNVNPLKTGDYFYFASGIEFEDIDTEVSVFRCVFHDGWDQGHFPCDLRLKLKSKAMEINKDTSAKEITNFIGEPSEIENKEDISIFYYDFDRHYYEFDISKDGKIVRLHAYLK